MSLWESDLLTAVDARGHAVDGAALKSNPADVAELATPQYSKSQIEKAGKVLRRTDLQPGQFFDSYKLSTEDAFRVAHNWRDAHMLPLLRVRQEPGAKTRAAFGKGATLTAARLKRMHAIRRKLQRPFTLYQIQDIAGCRAILPSIREVNELVAMYRNGESRYSIHNEDDYIAAPKLDGYRSHHVIVNFVGEGDLEIYNRQTVEVQLRTRMQHVWATAVEAAGLIRHENLKNGKGSADWLRLFKLMSAEFAEYENGALVPDTPASPRERRQEIRDLVRLLDALAVLDSYRIAINETENWQVEVGLDRYFLLQFDYETRQVRVEPFEEYAAGSERYIQEETQHSKHNTVLVEVDALSDLKRAFPNYFLDVNVFNDYLAAVIAGRPLAGPETVVGKPTPAPRQDWSFLKNWKFWRDKAKNRPRVDDGLPLVGAADDDETED